MSISIVEELDGNVLDLLAQPLHVLLHLLEVGFVNE